MDINQIIILCVIGFIAGVMSGFVGIGGGIIIVPALIYFLGIGQHEAQGTSLAMMLPPIGILAAMNYYQQGKMNITYAVVLCITFVVGGYFGSKLSLKMSPLLIKFIFGIIMLYASFKMIISGWGYFSEK
ncbi:MAG: sulfite exporter TauE/SafE family protein [Flavobacteriales bacterium]